MTTVRTFDEAIEKALREAPRAEALERLRDPPCRCSAPNARCEKCGAHRCSIPYAYVCGDCLPLPDVLSNTTTEKRKP